MNVNKIFLLAASICILNNINLSAQDTIRSKEIIVSASKIEIMQSEATKIVNTLDFKTLQKYPANSISDILKYVPNIDIRSRGDFGVQSDLSIGSGTYEQSLILIDGVPMNDVQTGHHNLNLPLDIIDIRKIEVLDGAAARILGANAFAGAVNILTEDFKLGKSTMGMMGGSNAYYKFYVNTQIPSFEFSNESDLVHYISFTKSQSDGHISNTDYNIKNFFNKNNLKTSFGIIELYLAYNDKKFGANSFYTAKYPNQYEETSTTLAGLKYSTGTELKFTSSIFWRKHNDEFQLFRNMDSAPSWYVGHNYHKTNSIIYDAKISSVNNFGFSTLNFNFRDDKIKSNVLGDAVEKEEVPFAEGMFFTKAKERQNIALSAEHLLVFDDLNISLGALANWNNDWKWNINYGIDANYSINNNLQILAGINTAMRYPTFTDLYYSGPTNRGNLNLKPEEAISYDLALRYNFSNFMTYAKVFYRNGNDLIDWVKPSLDSTVWTTMNLTELNTAGFTLSLIWQNDKENSNFSLQNISAAYTYLDAEKSNANVISYYNMNHLKHKLNSNISIALLEKINLDFAFTYKFRNGGFYDDVQKREVKYKDALVSDLTLRYNYDFITFTMQVNNALNTEYYDFAFIKSPGRVFRLGIELNEYCRGLRDGRRKCPSASLVD